MSEGLPFRAVSEYLAVAPQLLPSHMAAAAAAGFKSVINNRPDFEHGPGQPTTAEMAAAAEAAGLVYAFLPVDGGHQSASEIAEFAQLLGALPRPILAFCRSGARSTRLFMASQELEGD